MKDQPKTISRRRSAEGACDPVPTNGLGGGMFLLAQSANDLNLALSAVGGVATRRRRERVY